MFSAKTQITQFCSLCPPERQADMLTQIGLGLRGSSQRVIQCLTW